jgi:hypothetical protein
MERGGTLYSEWLTYYATSQKVVCYITDDVIGVLKLT